MEKKTFAISRPTLEELKQVFAFARQHRNVITKTLHNQLPDVWGEPGDVNEQAFYENLCSTMEDTDTRKVLEDSLGTLAQKKKSESWQRVLDLGRRFRSRATDELYQLDNELYEQVSPDSSDDFADEVISGLEKVGRPAYRKVGDWLESLYTVTNEDDVEDAAGAVKDDLPMPKTVEEQDAQWDEYLGKIQKTSAVAIEERFSHRRLVEISVSLKRLYLLLTTRDAQVSYEEVRNRERLGAALEGLAPCLDAGNVKDQKLRSLVETISGMRSRGELIISEAPGRQVVDIIEKQCEIAQSAKALRDELKAQALQALAEDDNDAVVRIIGVRKEQETALSEAKFEILSQLQLLDAQQQPLEPVPGENRQDELVPAVSSREVGKRDSATKAEQLGRPASLSEPDESLVDSADKDRRETIAQGDGRDNTASTPPTSVQAESSDLTGIGKQGSVHIEKAVPDSTGRKSDDSTEKIAPIVEAGPAEEVTDAKRSASQVFDAGYREEPEASQSSASQSSESAGSSLRPTDGNESPDTPETVSPEQEQEQEQHTQAELVDYKAFCRNRWIAPDGTCRLAPWLDYSFITRLVEASRAAIGRQDLAHLYILCRAQEKLDAHPLVASNDVRSIAQLWTDPASSSAGVGEDDRHLRLLQAVRQGYSREYLLTLTLLELVRPSGNFTPSANEHSEIVDALECSSPELHRIFETLLTFQQHGEDGWKRLETQFHGEENLSADEILEELSAERTYFQERVTRLWSAAAGKVQRTHCRQAWSEFVERFVAPLKEQLIPSAERGDFDGWDFTKLQRQIKKLPAQHAKIANAGGARFTDRKMMDKAAAEIADTALKIVRLAQDYRKVEKDSRFHGIELPIPDLQRLTSGSALSDAGEELCRLTVKILVNRSPVEHAESFFGITEADCWKYPDVLPLLGSGRGRSEGKWEIVVPVDAVEDPVRAAAVFLDGAKSGVLHDAVPVDIPRSLRIRLIESHRTDLLPHLVGSEQLDAQDKTRIHREENDRVERLYQAQKGLKKLRLDADALSLHSAARMEQVYRTARELLDDQERLHLELPLIASWLDSVDQRFTAERDQAVVHLRSDVDAIQDERRHDSLLAELKAGRYGHVLRGLRDGSSLSEFSAESERATVWRWEAEDRFPKPLDHLAAVSEDDEASDLSSRWIGLRNRRDRDAARRLRRAFYDFVSGEGELSTSRRKIMIPDGLRDIRNNQILINCSILITLLRQERLNPTFMPQLTEFSELVVMTPPLGVTPANAPRELSRSVGVERDRERLVVFLLPGLPSQSRDRVLSAFRRRDLRGAVLDDLDLCRLIGLGEKERPHGFLGLLEVILEQLNWKELSPYQSRDGQFIQLEMFVGRAREADKLAKTAEYSRVFSGRKLGKSALLKNVEQKFDRTTLPSRNKLRVLYIVVAGGESEQWLTDRIIDEIGSRFDKTPDAAEEQDPGQRLTVFLTEFFKVHKTVSLLVILDEADAFVEGQLKRYDEVRERCLSFRMMKEVPGGMDKNELPRVRFVFSGYRVTNTREGAWANAGGILRLSPLSEHEACRLVEGPLSRLGIDARDQSAAIARHCGFQPAIIIRFGDTLLKQVRLTHAAVGRRAVHISHADVVNSFHQSSVQEEIRTINDNNFQGNRVGRIIFWAMLMAFNDLLSGQGLEDAPDELLRRIREIDPDTEWLRKLDPSETGEILRNLHDFRDRELIEECQQTSGRVYRMKFPAHLPVLMTEEDPENQIRQDIQRVRETGHDAHLITNLLSPNQMDEIRYAMDEGKSEMEVGMVVAGAHWLSALQDDRGGIPDRLGFRASEVVDAQGGELPRKALKLEPLLVFNAGATTAQQVLTERRRQLSVPLLIGGVDLLRWAIGIGLLKAESMLSFAGLKRIDEARLTWWYERLRTIRFGDTNAIAQIMGLTSGIPALLSEWDRSLPTGYEIEIGETEFGDLCNRFSERMQVVARSLSAGTTANALSKREQQLLRMASLVARKNNADVLNLREELIDNWDVLYSDQLPEVGALYTHREDEVAVTVIREIGLLSVDGRGDVHLPDDDALHRLVEMLT